MKIVTLFVLFLLSSLTSFTQIKQGQFLIGGTFNFESTKSENPLNPTYESNYFIVSPNIGYFLLDNMATGLRIDFRSYYSKTETLKIHQNNMALSPFLRYYFLPVPKKVNVFIDVSYIHEKRKWRNNPNPAYIEKINGYNLSAGPSMFLTNQIALEFMLGYKHTKSDNPGATKENRFNSGIGLQIHLGKIKTKTKI